MNDNRKRAPRKHPLYKTFHDTVRKCTVPGSPNYEIYGSKGIGVCKRWLDRKYGFTNFLEDLGDKPEQRFGLIRYDFNKDYSKENCYWGDRGLINGRLRTVKFEGEDIPRTSHPLYFTWSDMIRRCSDIKFKHYKHYGGRGISVCDSWSDEEEGLVNFTEDMGLKPQPAESYSIDRIDVNGNYDPDNCRWATMRQQGLNKQRENFSKESEIRTEVENGKTYYFYRRKIPNHRDLRSKRYRTIDEVVKFRDEANFLIDNNLDWSHMLRSLPCRAKETSIVPGVIKPNGSTKWLVSKRHAGKRYRVGTYNTKEEAEGVMNKINERLEKGECFKDLIQIGLIPSKKIPNKTTGQSLQDHFEICPDTGLSIGYHVEEIENPSEKELTIDDLNPDRPFFISNDPTLWWPDHLSKDIEEGKIRIYKVLFKLGNYLVFKENKTQDHFKSIYFKLFELEGNIRLDKKTKWMSDKCKVNLFILHNESELFEAFLVNSNVVVKELIRL